MNDRIKAFMDSKGLSSSEFADSIGVQRSNVTHVLNGRNKPSFQFIAKMLEVYPEIDAKWLIMGQGEMFEESAEHTTSDLFSSTKVVEQPVNTPKVEVKSEPEYTPPAAQLPPKSEEKQVERVLIFYTDQTFKEYTPSK